MSNDASGGRRTSLPRALKRFLSTRDLDTPAAVRRAGGLARMADLPVAADHPSIRTLETQARLSSLPSIPEENEALAAAGFATLRAIAATPRQQFRERVREFLSDAQSERVYNAASMQSSYLTGAVIAAMVDGTYRKRRFDIPGFPGMPRPCGCDGCRSGTSPAAYLVDLLNYALDHLTLRRADGSTAPITLSWLQDTFCQPFRDLPASCEVQNARIRQVRICVEVLRRLLEGNGPYLSPSWYLEATYVRLLQESGTSYEEIRTAVRTSSADRDALATRLGIGDGQRVDALFRDPAAATGPSAITESWLQTTFGLRSTVVAPNAPDTRYPNLVQWRFQAQDDAWTAEDADTTSRPLEDLPVLDPDVVGLPDLASITPPATPRITRPRTEWTALDFWEDRGTWLATLRQELVTRLQGPAAGFSQQLITLFDDLQNPATFGVGRTGFEELTASTLLRLRKMQQSADPKLQDLLALRKLSGDELRAIGTVIQLADSGQPILVTEWDEFYDFTVGRIKRRAFYPVWQQEESRARLADPAVPAVVGIGLSLSPVAFRERDAGPAEAPDWRPVAGRATRDERRRWENLLRRRLLQRNAIEEQAVSAMDAVEDLLLPELRNDLLNRYFRPGTPTVARLRGLTQRLQIDCEAGACQKTTRIAQATQTLQGVLFGARNGLLPESDLRLEAEDFDAEWEWLGSYASWRAAREVFYYPENALRPTLRRQQSPPFRKTVERLRDAGRPDAAAIRQVLPEAEAYYRDVCDLDYPRAVVAGSTPDWQQLTLLISRAKDSGRHYFSAIAGDPTSAAAYQTFWTPIEVLNAPDAGEIFGLAYFGASETRRYAYLFVSTLKDGQLTVGYTRANVADLAEDIDRAEPAVFWESLTPLGLPPHKEEAEFSQPYLKPNTAINPPEVVFWLTEDGITKGYARTLDPVFHDWNRSTRWSRIQRQGRWKVTGPTVGPLASSLVCTTKTQADGSRWVGKDLHAGDFDGDGRHELLVTPDTIGDGASDFWAMKHDPATGSWSHLSPIPGHVFDADLDLIPLPLTPRFTLVGDFDGDRRHEIAVSVPDPNMFSLPWLTLTGRTRDGPPVFGSVEWRTLFLTRKFDPSTRSWSRLGGSTFENRVRGAFFASWTPLQNVDPKFGLVADIDQNSRDEILVAKSLAGGQGAAFWVMQLDQGAWQGVQGLQNNNETAPARFAFAGDFNGDGRNEVAVAREIAGDPGNDFWVSSFTQNWSEPTTFSSAGEGTPSRSGFACDFNGEGVAAFVLKNGQPGMWVIRQTQSGSWPTAAENIPCAEARLAVPGDFDSDGYQEVFTVKANPAGGADFQLLDWNPDTRTWSASDVDVGGMIRGMAGSIKGMVAGQFTRAAPEGTELALLGPGTSIWVIQFNLDAINADQRPPRFSYWKPYWNQPIELRPAAAEAERIILRTQSRQALEDNRTNRRSHRICLQEIFYFLPVELGSRLRESAFPAEALEWFRAVYDYAVAPSRAVVSHHLTLDQQSAAVFAPGDQWFRDPLDPHLIAEGRAASYTRFTLLSIVQCLREWADAQYSAGTAESVSLARGLYHRALDLLDGPELNQRDPTCDDLIAQVEVPVGEDERWVRGLLDDELRLLSDGGRREQVAAAVRNLLASANPLVIRYAAARDAIRAADGTEEGERSLDAVVTRVRDADAASALAILAHPAVSAGLDRLIATVGDARIAVSPENPGRSRVTYIPAPSFLFCVPPNPMPDGMRRHIQLALRNMESCRNIAGLEWELDPFPRPTAAQATTSFGSGDRLPTPASALYQPLPYRYQTLVERARQLVELARQIEASMLAAIQAGEQAAYERLKARQDLTLAEAGIRLRELHVAQARGSVLAAGMQQDRARMMSGHYQSLLNRGLSGLEIAGLATLTIAQQHQMVAAGFGWAAAFTSGDVVGGLGSAVRETGNAWAQASQILSQMAAFDRRAQEWSQQAAIAQQDIIIGGQQIALARGQLAAAQQEEAIAGLVADHARSVLDFLTTKRFLNQDLYDWMSGVLEGVYRFFLMQATAMARMAEVQLSFERRPLPGIIKPDYWQAPPGAPTPTNPAAPVASRGLRGLTGSARLLQDVYELDQYAFRTNRRKLQLSKTISLARMAPVEFHLFRQTGRLPFRTPSEIFDRDFPGHYLRLVRRVRASVAALIPPSVGIKASLASVGNSQVVIGGDRFQTVRVQRGPEAIALTSPTNATGVFELDAQPELVLPFEGIGVDGGWIFDMPRPANPFNYETIADVLVTIEYTALSSFAYREEVLRLPALRRRVSQERAFSLKQDFPDAWYDLHNPDLVDPPGRRMTVVLELAAQDFLPNLVSGSLSVLQVVLYAVPSGDTPVTLSNVELRVTPQGVAGGPFGGTAGTAGVAAGILSTRSGTANDWLDILGNPPMGRWELKFQDTPAVRVLFNDDAPGHIQDLLLAVTYDGEPPPWPA